MGFENSDGGLHGPGGGYMKRRFAGRDLREQYSLLLAILFAAICSMAAQYPAPQRIYVGITTQIFRQFAAAQNDSQLCWAASTQMILNWYRLPVTQEMIVERVKGARGINQGASDREISMALNGWVPAMNGGTWVVRSVTAPGPPPPTVLLNELNQLHPILLTFATGPSGGHAVVITAASYVPSPSGPMIQSLVIRDPWPSPEHIQTAGRVEYDGQALANFLPSIRGYWLVSVTPGSASPSVPVNRSKVSLGGGESVGSGDISSLPLCEALLKYVESAKHNFSSIKGELMDRDPKSTTYRAKNDATGYSKCRVNFYTDMEPALACDPADENIEELFQKVKSCIPSWPVVHHAYPTLEEYDLTGPDGVDVRLREKKGRIHLWVDAPSRD
jgi:Papain-like cysteine protease AvrRpt2